MVVKPMPPYFPFGDYFIAMNCLSLDDSQPDGEYVDSYILLIVDC